MAITFFDVETGPRDMAHLLLSEPRPDARLTDPAKILADIERKRQQDIAKLSLDPYGCRITVLAWARTPLEDNAIDVWPCADEQEEGEGLRLLLKDMQNTTLVGWNIRRFDLPVIIARCRLLGVPYPFHWDNPKFLRYGSSIVDPYELHTFYQGHAYQGTISASMKSACRIYGVDVPEDDISGADAPTADIEQVKLHVHRDIERLIALAVPLRVYESVSALRRDEIEAVL